MSKAEPYVYSLDGEHYRQRDEAAGAGWETREQALTAGREQSRKLAQLKATDPAPVWTAIKVGYQANAFYPTWLALVEHMGELADGEVGDEYVEGWPKTIPMPSDWTFPPSSEEDLPEGTPARELHDFVEQVLHPFLDQWVEKHGLQPTFWSTADVCKHADDDTGLVAP